MESTRREEGPAEAVVSWLDDGTPFAEAYGDVYRSRSGGDQAQAVFVEGNDLARRWAGGESITLLETGFGLGLNCAAALRAFADGAARWRAAGSVGPAPALVYRAIELHPVAAADLVRAHASRGELDAASRALVDAYPRLLEPGPVRVDLSAHSSLAAAGSLGVDLELVIGDSASALARVPGPVDAIFLDGFAPDRNPALWSAPVFEALAELARPGATLATYTVAGVVREGLECAGFDVERRPGFGEKRHRLVGRRRGLRA